MDDQKLQELLDREAIKELRYKIAQSLDFKDWALFGSLVLEQVDTDFSAIGVPAQPASRTEFIDSYRNNLKRPELKTQHIYSNFRITITGDTATSTFNQLSQHYLPGAEGGEEFFLRGEYTDKLVRTSEGWKLSGVTFVPFYSTGNPQILGS